MKIHERQLQAIGSSLLVTLPKEWTKVHKLKKGAAIKMEVTGDGSLRIAPEFTKSDTREEISIKYDENFVRTFFRAYFEENQTIKVDLPVKFKDRKNLYGFLRKFMNVQVVEDSDKHIVIKCFRIDDLTIMECLQRMHHLCLTMIDTVLENNDAVKIDELEETLTRFYYILVMQIRRFLSEGKYTERNQLTLIRAMDCRMVAEKIERIADLAKQMDALSAKDKRHLKLVRGYCAKATYAFLSENFDAALELWKTERTLLPSNASRDLQEMLSYARQISGLVR